MDKLNKWFALQPPIKAEDILEDPEPQPYDFTASYSVDDVDNYADQERRANQLADNESGELDGHNRADHDEEQSYEEAYGSELDWPDQEAEEEAD